jgi:predicted Rossmann fold nucleotide-binding protein DprA/Smf involved in DNA uptake
MINQGFEIIPITSSEYSPILKENMKASNAPPLIYVKGNKQLLKEHTIAIVGSRTASEKAIQFTDTVAGSASRSFKVVVSGFAKGVDRQALDSAIAHTGQSIIVLPQGITTFASGFKKYYQQIAEGNVLVLSSFHPRAPWQVELAMARNPIIYGLAKDIYVAETSESGGTWSGAIDGLRRGRTVYVRNPEDGEKNANHLLIEKGGIPVDMHGERIAESENTVFMVKEEMPVETLEDKINKLLLGGALSPEDIDRRLSLSWGKEKLIRYLNSLDTIEKIKIGRKNHYRIKQSGGEANMTLFS